LPADFSDSLTHEYLREAGIFPTLALTEIWNIRQTPYTSPEEWAKALSKKPGEAGF
jgi:hypothetical protein